MLVLDQTRIRLAAHVRLDENGIYDAVRHFHYHLTDAAHEIMTRMVAGEPFGSAVRAVTSAADPQARDAAAGLVVALAEEGVLHEDRRTRLRRVAAALAPRSWTHGLAQVLTFDYRSPSPRRFPGTLGGLVHAMLPVAVTIATVSGLLSGWLFVALVDDVAESRPALLISVLLPITGGVLVVASVIAHEMGHLVSMPRRRPRVVVRRGLAVAVAHARLRGGRAAVVALAGPLAACALCAALASLLLTDVVVASDELALAPAVVLLVGLSHLWALLPWHHDGRMLLRGWREAGSRSSR